MIVITDYLHIRGKPGGCDELSIRRHLAAVCEVVHGVWSNLINFNFIYLELTNLFQNVSLQVPDDEFCFIVTAGYELAGGTDAHTNSVRLMMSGETDRHTEVSQTAVRLLPHLVDLRSRD